METGEGIDMAKETWLWDVLHKAYVTVEKAFGNLQDCTFRRQLSTMKTFLAVKEGERDPDLLYRTYTDGKKHHQNPHLQKEHVFTTHPAAYTLKLLQDPEFLVYEAGRLHFRDEHLNLVDFHRAVNRLAKTEEEKWSLEEAEAFFRKFDGSSFLVRDNRLHIEDFGRFFNRRGVTDPNYQCMENAAKMMTVASGDNVDWDKKNKIATKTSQTVKMVNKIQRERALEISSERQCNTLVTRLRDELEHLGEANKAIDGLPPHVQLKLNPIRLVVQLGAKPPVAFGFAALDADMRGVLPVSKMKLAMLQAGVSLLSCETVLLSKVARCECEPGRVDWLRLLDHLQVERGTDIPPQEWSAFAEVEGIMQQVREWEQVAIAKVAQLEGRPAEPSDLMPYLIFNPSIKGSGVQEVRLRIHRYSIGVMAHPIFDSDTVQKLVRDIMPPMKRLGRLLCNADPDLLDTITEADLKYVMKCTPGSRLNSTRYTTVMAAFRGELAPGLRAVQTPRIYYGPFIRALSPTMADLWVEKLEMGIDAWDPIYDGDIEAVMSGLSAALYGPYTALRQQIVAQDVAYEGAITSEQLYTAAQAAGFTDFLKEDADWAKRYFSSETQGKLNWELFMAVVASAIDGEAPLHDRLGPHNTLPEPIEQASENTRDDE